MERGKSTAVLKLALFLALLGQGASEILRDLHMCGTWVHGKSRNISFDVGKGCQNITIAANETNLSIYGRITGDCENSSTIPLPPQTSAGGKSFFCVFWDPLLDLLQVQIEGRTHTLCKSAALQASCCTSLSRISNANASGRYGIENGAQRDDVLQGSLQEFFTFYGREEDCRKDLCSEHSADLIEKEVLRSGVIGQVDLPCSQVFTKRLQEGFQGLEFIMQAPQATPLKSAPSVSVRLPPSLAPSDEPEATVVLTYYTENTLFQTKDPEIRILNEVVGISVGDRVISHLPEPVRIVFRHAPVEKNETTKCVSWDTKKDPDQVTWREDGCKTHRREREEEAETECHCDHLTYFAILVELNPGSPVDGLEALTYVTSVCCAISLCSCVALIILHTRALSALRKQERPKSSIPIHRNLAVSLLLLCTLFVLTGVFANAGSEEVCLGVGAALHYALLCFFSWMAIEVCKAFWLVHRPLGHFLSHRVCGLLGFGLPALLVLGFACIGNVYGTRYVAPSDDITSSYKMCWIMDTSWGRLIHYITNVSFPFGVVFAGLGMLVLVLRQVQDRKEWRQKRVTFFSIWGLSCLFGCTWGLGLFTMGPQSKVAMFLFCIINGLQGFFLLVRFFLLERVTKSGSDTESRTTGSTRQNMLHDPE